MEDRKSGRSQSRPGRASLAPKGPLVTVTHVDETGRSWRVQVPQGREEDAARGVVLGPPDTKVLNLPEDIAIRLHNQLYARGLITWADVKRRQGDVFGALQAALKVSATGILNLYREVT